MLPPRPHSGRSEAKTEKAAPAVKAAGRGAAAVVAPVSASATAGNLAVGRLLGATAGAQFTLGRPDDTAEHEADRLAERALGGSPASAGPPAERVATSPSRARSFTSGGEPLDRATRTHFEGRFQRDFGDVRVHGGRQAEAASRLFGARAFTVGSDIFLGGGRHASVGGPEGRVLAHELAHVALQDREGAGRGPAVIRRSPESDLIGAHTTVGFLNEETLGRALLARANLGEHAFVRRVLDELGSTDQDDVAYEMVRVADDAALDGFAGSESGRRMLDQLYDHLTSGSVAEEETTEADRILRAKTRRVDVAEFEVAPEHAKIFPFRLPGLTVLNDAPIMAERRGAGRIWIKMPVRVLGTDMFREETRTLPTDVFIGGVELPENEIVGVKMYDLGGEVHYRPALYLIQLSNQTTTTVLEKMAEAAGLGLTLGLGTAAAGAAEATWLARALIWADRAALALGTITSLIREHRGWIIAEFGDSGRQFLRYVDIVNSAVAIYGLGRAAIGLGQTINSLRTAYRNWRTAAAAAEELTTSQRATVAEIGSHTDDFLAEADRLRAPRGTTEPPPTGRPAAGTDLPEGTPRAGVTDVEPVPVEGAPGSRRPTRALSAAEEAALSPAARTARTTLHHAVCGACFPAGTAVLTAAGRKNIEDIQAGDLVLSASEDEPARRDFRAVVQTFQNVTDTLLEVQVAGRKVQTTPGHVWWAAGRGWVLASELAAGDEVLDSHGSPAPIDSIRSIAGFAVTYNFEVAGFHTYFVADGPEGPGFWVHNNSVGFRVLRPDQLFQLILPSVVITDRGAVRAAIGNALVATGSYSTELGGLYQFIRRGRGAGHLGITADAVDHLEVVMGRLGEFGGGVVAAVDVQRIGGSRIIDLRDEAVIQRLLADPRFARIEASLRTLSGEGVVAVRGKVPARAVQSLVSIPPGITDAERQALLLELAAACR
jgi:hypothetical protein